MLFWKIFYFVDNCYWQLLYLFIYRWIVTFFVLLFCFAYKFNVYVTLLIRQKKKIRIKSFFLFLISFHFHILLSRIAEFQRFHIWTQYHRIKPWCLMPDHFHSWIMSFIYPLIQIHKINLWECIKSILTLFKA